MAASATAQVQRRARVPPPRGGRAHEARPGSPASCGACSRRPLAATAAVSGSLQRLDDARQVGVRPAARSTTRVAGDRGRLQPRACAAAIGSPRRKRARPRRRSARRAARASRAACRRSVKPEPPREPARGPVAAPGQPDARSRRSRSREAPVEQQPQGPLHHAATASPRDASRRRSRPARRPRCAARSCRRSGDAARRRRLHDEAPLPVGLPAAGDDVAHVRFGVVAGVGHRDAGPRAGSPGPGTARTEPVDVVVGGGTQGDDRRRSGSGTVHRCHG